MHNENPHNRNYKKERFCTALPQVERKAAQSKSPTLH